MARPGQLAEAIADVLDLGPATVRQQARMLRDAGLMAMEKGGRGKGSMTPRDAVHLLLAAAGTSRVRDSTNPVEYQGACQSDGVWTLPFDGLPELEVLGARHTLSDALEALVQAAIRGLANQDVNALWAPAQEGAYIFGPLPVRVSIHEPLAHSTITVGPYGRVDDGDTDVPKSVSRTYTNRPADGETSFPFYAGSPGDLTHVHMFTERAIVRIAQEFGQG